MTDNNRLLLLIFLCVVGLGACFFAQKNGPLPIGKPAKTSEAPPGWMPQPQQQQNVVPNGTFQVPNNQKKNC